MRIYFLCTYTFLHIIYIYIYTFNTYIYIYIYSIYIVYLIGQKCLFKIDVETRFNTFPRSTHVSGTASCCFSKGCQV